MLNKCPGSDKFRQPYPEFIKCPFCKAEVEIWADEIKAVCPKCKKAVTRAQGQSCLDWCEFAKECVGEEAYKKHLKNKNIGNKKK